MSKENEEKEVGVEDIVETQDDEGNDTTDWKTLAQSNNKIAKDLSGKNKGIAQRYKTKIDKLKEGLEDKKPEEKKNDPSKSDELDYGKKAFLVANGVKGEKETELVENIMSETGKTMEQVLESKYFKAELEEIRALKETEDALPKGSKKAGQSAQDTVEYWIAKKELPKDRELRQKVVNARINKEKNKSVFE